MDKTPILSAFSRNPINLNELTLSIKTAETTTQIPYAQLNQDQTNLLVNYLQLDIDYLITKVGSESVYFKTMIACFALITIFISATSYSISFF